MNSTQAQKGFKTFIATLFVSFVVFSTVYYLASELSTTKYEKELNTDVATPQVENKTTTAEEKPLSMVTAPTVLSAQTTAAGTPETPTVQEEPSVFKELAAQKMDVAPKSVLAGATTNESTTPAVPATGSTEITLGLTLSLGIFLVGMYWITKGPKPATLKDFEDRFTQE